MSAIVYDMKAISIAREKYLPPTTKPWKIARVKQVYDVQLGKMLQPEQNSIDDVLIPYLKALHVQWESVATNELPQMWASESDIKNYQVQNGDLLICEGGEVGRGAVVRNLQQEAIIQNSLHRVRSTPNALNEFLLYCMEHISRSGWLDVICNKATIAHLTGEKLGELRIYLPSPEEQHQIASFLDTETAKLDTLVEKKQRLIELLQEYRQALITQAVTKGLDPNVPMKDSGIEWLGEVPAHWSIKRVKHVTGLITSGSRGWAQYYSEQGTLFIRVGNISREKGIELDLTEIQYVSPPSGSEGERTKVDSGDVLVAITGATIGSIAVVPEGLGTAYVNQHTALVRPKQSEVFSRWLAYSLRAAYTQTLIDLLSRGGTKEGLSLEDVGNFVILVPPVHEQKLIVSYVDEKGSELERASNTLHQQISLLNEYRQELISAAVTGQIDVRDFSPASAEEVISS